MIYCVQAGNDYSRVKVGFSVDPQRRLRELQTGQSSKMHFVRLVAGPKAAEEDFHYKFKDKQISNEWYLSEPFVFEWFDKPSCRVTEPAPTMTIGDRIRAFRVQKGLTQERLAHNAGVSVSTLNRQERNVHTPSMSSIRKIASGLGVTMAEVIGVD